jgi:uncharacterized OB-fold protein
VTSLAPQVDPLPPFAEFAAGLADARLMLQRCTVCSTVQLGRIRCDRCLAPTLTWIRSGERGAIHAFATMHKAYHPAFAERLPYNVGYVELDEGPRIVAGFAIDRARLRAGLRVRVAWGPGDAAGPLCFVEEGA